MATIPGVNDDVLAGLLWDPDGSGPQMDRLVLGGRFSHAGDAPARHIVSWDGARWKTFGEGLPGQVEALGIFEGSLIASTNSEGAADGIERSVMRWNGAAWEQLGATFTTNVYQIIEHNDSLLVGLRSPHNGSTVQRWTGAAWEPVGASYTYGASAMLSHDGDLYVNATWSSGTPRGVGKWNGVEWVYLSAGLPTSSSSNSVGHLFVWNGELVIAGTGIWPRRWNGTQWQTFGTPPTPTNSQSAWLGMFQGQLIARANFGAINGASFAGFASWDGAAWVPMDATTTVFRGFTELRGELLGWGDVEGVEGLGAQGVAAWNGTTWRTLCDGIGALDNQLLLGVFALGEHAGRAILGGYFSAVAGGQASPNIVAWNGSAWERLGDGLDGPVFALETYQGDLIAAGACEASGATGLNHIGRWDGAAWQPLGDGVDGVVWALTTWGDDLIAAGDFTHAGDAPAARVARWNGEAWSPMGGGFEATVYALSPFGADLIAGGVFTTTPGATTLRVARWDGAQWRSMGGGFGSPVYALHEHNGVLYAGGVFNTVFPFVTATRIAKWTGSAWAPVAGGIGTSGHVNALASHRGELVAAGTFTFAGGAPASRVAAYNGAAWRALDEGVSLPVIAARSIGGKLWVGLENPHGSITQPVGRWGAPALMGDVNADERVDFADLNTLLTSFGACAGDPAYFARADFDENGCVDFTDLNTVLTTYGVDCAAPR